MNALRWTGLWPDLRALSLARLLIELSSIGCNPAVQKVLRVNIEDLPDRRNADRQAFNVGRSRPHFI
jgi:hypothetical protein